MARLSLTVKTLLLASGKAITALSAVLATVVLTRTLSKADYATHKQVLLVFSMASPLLMMGLPRALYYFLPGEEKRPRAVLLENLLPLFAGAALFGLALLLGLSDLFARRFDNDAVALLALLMAPYALFMFPSNAFSACMMARDRVKPLLAFSVVSRLLLLGVLAVAAIGFGTAAATLGAQVAWAVGAGVVAIYLMLRVTKGGVERRPRLAGIITQLKFSVPLGLASMLGALSSQLDKYIVSDMCSTEAFAIYVTGALEIPLIGIVTGAMNAVVLPELAKFYKAGETGRIVDLWQRAMNKALLVLIPVMFVILILGTELVVVLFSSAYEDAADPLRIYALMLPQRAAVYGSVLMATNNTRYVTAAALLGLVLNVVLSIVFVQWMGYTGAAWASALTTYGVVAYMLRPMSRALETPIIRLVAWGHFGKVMLAAGLPAVAIWLAADFVPLAPALRLLLLGGAYGLLVALIYEKTGIATIGSILAFLRGRGRRLDDVEQAEDP